MQAKLAHDKQFQKRLAFDIIPQLQANFAFTKAYVADQSGSEGGLKGPKCFVDLALFKGPPPAWIETDGLVKWSNDRLRLHATFMSVLDLRSDKHPQGGPSEIRDGLEIAQYLTNNAGVLRALRSAKSMM